MRTPEEIEQVLSAIRDVWLEYPNMRLCQLLVNAVRINDPTQIDLFSVEDSKLVRKLGVLAKRLRESK